MCISEQSSTQDQDETASTENADLNRITLSDAMAQRVKIGRPELIELADKLPVPSQIEVDRQKLVRVGANVTGRIVEVSVRLGENVKAGTELARISSPELTTAQLAYLRAYSLTQLNTRAAQRARLLLDADVIGSAELQRREAELQVSRAELSAAKAKLHLLGVFDDTLNDLAKRGDILPSVAITASRGGTVIQRNVVVGQVVQPSDLLFKVADLSTVWVVGNVPEHNARDVAVGQHVQVQVPALGKVSFDGLIVYVADTVNPQTRTITVRTAVENPDRKLKRSMLARMHITEDSHKYLVVPKLAVVREENQDYVFIAETKNRFFRVPVELDHVIGNVRPVLEGLSTEQSIVIEGAFHLDNQRKLAELE
jgi:cobalt-zinc-cadmium efflux system membrane fusion protein